MKVEKNLDATLVAMAVAPVVVVALVPLGVLAVAQAVAQELAKVVVVVHALMEVEVGNIKLLTGTWQSGIAKNITFIVTKDCQLACRYCYLVGKNEKERMSWDVAKKAIDYILDHENDMREESVVWDFIGGEPFLEIDLIDRICDYLKISPADFFNLEVQNTTYDAKLMEQFKKLSPTQAKHILFVINEMIR